MHSDPTTSTRPASASGHLNDMVPMRARRRPWLVATGALLAAVGALSVVWLVGAAGQRQEVIAVRQEVAYGEVIEAADLGLSRVSVDPGIDVVPAGAQDLLIGQVATTRLVPGMLLAPGMVAPAGEPSEGRVLVPIAVPIERMPAGGLRAGDRILTVDIDPGSVAEDGSPAAPAAGTPTPATVVRIGPMDVNGITVVDVTTAAPQGPALAAAAAAGRVALVVQPSVG
jgi:hypothetical protein